MAVFNISNFVGEAPSVSSRALGASMARRNHNLYLPSAEFWPLPGDVPHSSCPAGTLTLHRFQRNAAGEVIKDPSAPLRSFTDLRSFVKGQVNEESTERTYYTFDTGLSAPRVCAADGTDRVLGVLRPNKPVVVANAQDEFSSNEARDWLYGEFVQQVIAAFHAHLYSHNPADQGARRFNEQHETLAGAFENYGMQPWNLVGVADLQPADLYAQVSDERVQAAGMKTLQHVATRNGAHWLYPITAAPLSWRLDLPGLVEALTAIQYPDHAGGRAGSAVLTYAAALQLAGEVNAAVNAPAALVSLRTELSAAVKEFANVVTAAEWTSPAVRPVAPQTPTVGEWYEVGGDGPTKERTPQWVAYDAALIAYNQAMAEYNAGLAKKETKANELNARMEVLRTKAYSLSTQIEAVIAAAWERVMTASVMGAQAVDALQLFQGLAEDLTERYIDSRFYVVAFVTDWGEESEPSPVSDMLEVDQNDTVTVQRPGSITGESLQSRHITKWRLYRSNTSGTAAVFQLVAEVPASVAQFEDDKASEELDSLQPQFTWCAPPYRQDSQYEGLSKPVVGSAPYLRGMTGMPNGIMAGFIDSTVMFCEPYVPYAWPVEYRVTTEHPIVALAVFDNTLFVGTIGNPYLITGAHSASMSAQKLDSNQSCASARACVGVQGGVLFPSPDGLCLANASGVNVISGQHFAAEDWRKLQPESMFAVEHEGIYHLFYAGDGGGCLVVDLRGGLKMGRVDLRGTAAWVDRLRDVMYVAQDTQVLQCYSASARRTGLWRSGVVTFPKQEPIGWVKVYGLQTAESPVVVRWFADGQLRHTATFTSLQPQRLPPGRWLEHEVEIESAARLTTVVLASTSQELRGV